MSTPKRLYYWVLKLEISDGLAVIDLGGTLYYASLEKWNTLVDHAKKDFRKAKVRVVLLPGAPKVCTPAISHTKSLLEQMLANPHQIDSLRSSIQWEYIFGTEQQRQVWDFLVDKIPVGTTSSYLQIADALGVKSARVVGNACGANRIPLLVPCHRVLRANGANTGYRWGTTLKDTLIELEKAG